MLVPYAATRPETLFAEIPYRLRERRRFGIFDLPKLPNPLGGNAQNKMAARSSPSRRIYRSSDTLLSWHLNVREIIHYSFAYQALHARHECVERHGDLFLHAIAT